METVNGYTVIASQDSIEPTLLVRQIRPVLTSRLSACSRQASPRLPFTCTGTDEAFYVAEGDATFLLGDREVTVTRGGLVFVPRGTAHTVWNSGDGPVRGLIVISPGDADHSFAPSTRVRRTVRVVLQGTFPHAGACE